MYLPIRLYLHGPTQAIALPKADLVRARNAGYTQEHRDPYGYLVVTLTPAGTQHVLSPAVRTEAVIRKALPAIRKVTPDGQPWPALAVTPPASIIGHVRNWLRYAHDSAVTPRPRNNGLQHCIEQGYITHTEQLTTAGIDAAIALGAIAVTPHYELEGKLYRLEEIPLPLDGAVQPEPVRSRCELAAALVRLARSIDSRCMKDGTVMGRLGLAIDIAAAASVLEALAALDIEPT